MKHGSSLGNCVSFRHWLFGYSPKSARFVVKGSGLSSAGPSDLHSYCSVLRHPVHSSIISRTFWNNSTGTLGHKYVTALSCGTDMTTSVTEVRLRLNRRSAGSEPPLSVGRSRRPSLKLTPTSVRHCPRAETGHRAKHVYQFLSSHCNCVDKAQTDESPTDPSITGWR